MALVVAGLGEALAQLPRTLLFWSRMARSSVEAVSAQVATAVRVRMLLFSKPAGAWTTTVSRSHWPLAQTGAGGPSGSGMPLIGPPLHVALVAPPPPAYTSTLPGAGAAPAGVETASAPDARAATAARASARGRACGVMNASWRGGPAGLQAGRSVRTNHMDDQSVR